MHPCLNSTKFFLPTTRFYPQIHLSKLRNLSPKPMSEAPCLETSKPRPNPFPLKITSFPRILPPPKKNSTLILPVESRPKIPEPPLRSAKIRRRSITISLIPKIPKNFLPPIGYQKHSPENICKNWAFCELLKTLFCDVYNLLTYLLLNCCGVWIIVTAIFRACGIFGVGSLGVQCSYC